MNNPLQKFREIVTALLAGAIVLLFAGLLAAAFTSIPRDNATYANIKDLLSIITPMLGMVLGFYFNKSSTEGRAESAEKNVQIANDAVATAKQDSVSAQKETALVKSSLSELVSSGKGLLADVKRQDVLRAANQPAGDQPEGMSVMFVDERANALARFEEILERAERIV